MKDYDLIFEDNNTFADYRISETNEALTVLPKFNLINIIIGANNSGKSRFLRNLMSRDELFGIHCLEDVNEKFQLHDTEVKQINQSVSNILKNYMETSSRTTYISGEDPNKGPIAFLQKASLNAIESDFQNAINIMNENKIKLSKLKAYGIKSQQIDDLSIDDDFCYNFSTKNVYYIPTLRTAHSLYKKLDEKLEERKYEKIENDLFLHTYLRNYKINDNVEIFTGLHLYRDILNSRNSEKAVRVRFESFENFLSLNFFDGKQVDIVAKFDKDDNERGINESEHILIHVAGDKETRKLYDLGDGVQAIIVLMYKIFMAENNSLIFIDEPELNLHPGMQRLFLQQISQNEEILKKNLRFIISTHSNHFLDLTIELDYVSIYSFSPRDTTDGEKSFLIKNVNRGDNSLLKDLGVNNSSVFMANCSIWVEGISDRNYIKLFLKSYLKYLKENDDKKYINIKEDIDYAFFEYAGSNLDHYIFESDFEIEDAEVVLSDIKALSISNRIFLLADSDCAKLTTNKGKRLKALEDLRSDSFVPKVLRNVREVENLLTNDIWEQALLSLCNKTLLEKYTNEIQIKVQQTLGKINSSDYKKKYIGEFLNAVRDDLAKISSKYILNKSTYEVKDHSYGTLKNKRDLSEFIFEKDFSWELLSVSPDIQHLTIEIYNFICRRHVELV